MHIENMITHGELFKWGPKVMTIKLYNGFVSTIRKHDFSIRTISLLPRGTTDS